MTKSPPICWADGAVLDRWKRKTRLTTLTNTKAYLAVTTKKPVGITRFSALLFASLAVLVPLANAQQRDNTGVPTPNAPAGGQESQATMGLGENAKIQPTIEKLPRSNPADFNRDIYYRNKLEFALDVGWLPLNIPFPFDVLEGDPYDLYPLRYTLVPILASLRWQVDDVGSPWILRGNWDVTFTASFTAIPKGAETHYFSYDMGLRRNFVQRNWRVVPYVDIRAGLGLIDAKGPLGVYYAQGQNYTFTMNMGAGARYNFNSRYAISAGLNWMHISNNNLSAPQYSNYGINVYGPMFGLDIAVRPHSRHSEQ
jgi:lipid A 3-O-deacylase PagL